MEALAAASVVVDATASPLPAVTCNTPSALTCAPGRGEQEFEAVGRPTCAMLLGA